MPENNTENINIITNKKVKNRSLIAFNIIEMFLVICIIILFYVTIPMSSTKVIFIPKGSTNNTVSYLNTKGFELNIIDKILLRSIGFIQSGWIDVNENTLTKMDFLYKLTTSKAALKNIT